MVAKLCQNCAASSWVFQNGWICSGHISYRQSHILKFITFILSTIIDYALWICNIYKCLIVENYISHDKYYFKHKQVIYTTKMNCICTCFINGKTTWLIFTKFGTHIPDIGMIVSVRQWPRRLGFNPRSSHTNDSKNGAWYLLA